MRVFETFPLHVPHVHETEAFHIRPANAGLVVGSFLGLWHLGWSLLVAAGAAQWLLDWVFYLHFMNNPLQVLPFDFGIAAALVSATFVVGFVVGSLLAVMWNALHKP